MRQKLFGLMTSILLFISFNDWALSYIIPNHNAGFFSNFLVVLGALDCGEKEGMALKIDYGKQGLYYDPQRGPNWWTYYFEQLQINDFDNNTAKLIPHHMIGEFAQCAYFHMTRQQAHEIIKKYIRIKPHILKKLNQFRGDKFGKKFVIGCHYRGTDKVFEAPKVSYEAMLKEIAKVISVINAHRKEWVIFVATDEKKFLRAARKLYKNKVVYTNSYRSTTHQGVHADRHFNNYQKGEDALIDALLLSHCNILVRTSSNLSFVSKIINPVLPVIELNVGFLESQLHIQPEIVDLNAIVYRHQS